MINYICIVFGKDTPDKFWNYSSCNYRYKSHAEKFGLNEICNASVLGYVVIEEGEDFWEIVDEYNTENTSIGYSNRNGYTVQPAPKLILV